MRIVCPSCNTAYDAPDTVVASGKPMRCARCRTEWTPGKPPEAAPPPASLSTASFTTASPPQTSPPQTSPPPAVVSAPEYVPQSQPAPEPSATPLPEPSVEPQPAQPLPRLAEPPLAAPEPVILAPFPDPLPEPEPAKKMVIAAWGASALVLILALWLAIAYRQPIMRGWPASARAYAALGYK